MALRMAPCEATTGTAGRVVVGDDVVADQDGAELLVAPLLLGEGALELLLVDEPFANQEVPETSANRLSEFRLRHHVRTRSRGPVRLLYSTGLFPHIGTILEGLVL